MEANSSVESPTSHTFSVWPICGLPIRARPHTGPASISFLGADDTPKCFNGNTNSPTDMACIAGTDTDAG